MNGSETLDSNLADFTVYAENFIKKIKTYGLDTFKGKEGIKYLSQSCEELESSDLSDAVKNKVMGLNNNINAAYNSKFLTEYPDYNLRCLLSTFGGILDFGAFILGVYGIATGNPIYIMESLIMFGLGSPLIVKEQRMIHEYKGPVRKNVKAANKILKQLKNGGKTL